MRNEINLKVMVSVFSECFSPLKLFIIPCGVLITNAGGTSISPWRVNELATAI